MDQCQHYYHMCSRYKGKQVTITDFSGVEYRGRIVNVDQQYVYLEQEGRGFGGFGYGYYGGFYGGYYRPIVPIALAGIAGFALGALFFW
ncbi:hypothetical protein ACM26V_10290 [Salipaludibacillus sp. HK11]|uniref:hypothetical protein n=1 Tax=Salipaludibacillus sp. HK11 TaxID=3394320 RepID=UPI0039FBD747